ncbi:MAG: TlpA family protein disulfide reductase [Pseudomonadota bacterium]
MKKWIAPVLVLALAAALGLVWLAPSGLERIPDFRASDLDGQTIDSEALRGKPVFMTFWATSCVTCVAEIPHLVDLHEKYATQGLTVLAVALDYDPIEQLHAMREERQLPYTIVHDADGGIAEAFGGVRLTPTNLLISPEGKVTFRKIGEVNFDRIERDIRGML